MRIPILLAAQLQASLSSSTSKNVEETLSISGPSTLRSCIPSTFKWTSTSSPYTLSLIEHSSLETETSSETEVGEIQEEEEMVIITNTKATWIVDISPGKKISLLIKDSEGNTAQTLPWVVEEGTTGCLDGLD